MATPSALRDLADAAAAGPKTATSDGLSATQHDPLVMEELADRRAGQSVVDGANEQGGSRSGWGMLRPAQAILPGQR